MSTTLAQMRELVRQRADQQTSQFITDTELNGYINNSYGELYDVLVSRFEDYYSTQLLFSITSGNTEPLPADHYKMRGLDFKLDSANWTTVYPYNFIQRNQGVSGVRLVAGKLGVTYRIIGGNINIIPEDRANGDYRLWYIPRYTKLVGDADEIGDVLDFEEYIIVDAAIKCMIKEESDPSMLIMLKGELKKRIESMASNRDAGSPEVVGDTNRNNRAGWVANYGWWW